MMPGLMTGHLFYGLIHLCLLPIVSVEKPVQADSVSYRIRVSGMPECHSQTTSYSLLVFSSYSVRSRSASFRLPDTIRSTAARISSAYLPRIGLHCDLIPNISFVLEGLNNKTITPVSQINAFLRDFQPTSFELVLLFAQVESSSGSSLKSEGIDDRSPANRPPAA